MGAHWKCIDPCAHPACCRLPERLSEGRCLPGVCAPPQPSHLTLTTRIRYYVFATITVSGDLRKAARPPPGHCRYEATWALAACGLRALLRVGHYWSILGTSPAVKSPWFQWGPELLSCCDVLLFLTIQVRARPKQTAPFSRPRSSSKQTFLSLSLANAAAAFSAPPASPSSLLQRTHPAPEALYATLSLASLALLCGWHAVPCPAHPHLYATALRVLAAQAVAMAATVYMSTTSHRRGRRTCHTAGAQPSGAAVAVTQAGGVACVMSSVGGGGVGTRDLVQAWPGHRTSPAQAASDEQERSRAVVGPVRQGAGQTKGGAEYGGTTGDRWVQQGHRGAQEEEWDQVQVRLGKHCQQQQEELVASRAVFSPRGRCGPWGEHQGTRRMSLSTLTLTPADGVLERELRGGPPANAMAGAAAAGSFSAAAARDSRCHRGADGGKSSGGDMDPSFSFPLLPNSQSSPKAAWGVAQEALGSQNSVRNQACGGPVRGADCGGKPAQQGEPQHGQCGGALESAGGLARMCEAASPCLTQHVQLPPVEPMPRVRVARHPFAETGECLHAEAPGAGPSPLPYLDYQGDQQQQQRSQSQLKSEPQPHHHHHHHHQQQQQQQQQQQVSIPLPLYRSSMRYHTLSVKIPDARPDQLAPNFEQLLDAEIKRVTGGDVPGERGVGLGRLREVAVRPGCIELEVVTEYWCGGEEACGVAGCFVSRQRFGDSAGDQVESAPVNAMADSRQLVVGSGSGGGRVRSGPGVAVEGLRTLLLLQHQQHDAECRLGAAAGAALEGDENVGAGGGCEAACAEQGLAVFGGTAAVGLESEVCRGMEQQEQGEQLLAWRRPRLMAPMARVGSGRRQSYSSAAGVQIASAPGPPGLPPSVLCVHPRVLQLPPAPPSAEAVRERNPPLLRRARYSTGSVALPGHLAAIRADGGRCGYRRHSVNMSCSSSDSAGRDALLGNGGDGEEELDVLADCSGTCLAVGVRRVLSLAAHAQQQQQQQQQQSQEGMQRHGHQQSWQKEPWFTEEALGQGACVVRVVIMPPGSVWEGPQRAGAPGGEATTADDHGRRCRPTAAQRHQHQDDETRCYDVLLWGLGDAAWGTRTRGSSFAGILLHLRWRGRPFCCVPLLLAADPRVAGEVRWAADTWPHAHEDLDQLLMDLATWSRHVAAHASPHASRRISPAASQSHRHTPFPPPPPSSPALGSIPPAAAALDAAALDAAALDAAALDAAALDAAALDAAALDAAALDAAALDAAALDAAALAAAARVTAWGRASAAGRSPGPSACAGPGLASSPSPSTNPRSCHDPRVSLSHRDIASRPVTGPWSATCPWPGPDPRVSLELGGDLLWYARACGWRATRRALEGQVRRLAGALGLAGGAETERVDE